MYRTASRIARRCSAAILVAVVALVVTATPASAHTGFESSNPGDGQTIDQPVTEISLTFSGDATPAGEGFVVLDPSGQIREPDEVTSVDNLTWTLRFDEPLVGGAVGVRWRVAAPDAHPIDGSFSFTVIAEAPAAPEPAADEVAAPPAAAEVTSDVPEAEPAATPADPQQETEPDEASTGLQTEDGIDLESFLDTDADVAPGASWLFRLSRVLRLLGAVGGIGGAVFAALVLRSDASEVRSVLYWVRRAGAVLILGSVGTAVAQTVTLESSWSGLWSTGAWGDTVWSSLGIAIALRLFGGGLVMTAAGVQGTETRAHEGDQAWNSAASPAVFVGMLLIVASFLFDGHTVAEGPRWLHATANLVHVVTAATWAGGVAMLALVIALRRRNNVATRSLQLAVRFSVVATIALVAAGIAGISLSAIILDSPSQLWSTSWGQLLLVKVALVAIAASCGAYNHRVIVPELKRSAADAAVAHRFRNVITLEAIALLAVTVTTALLIGASTT